MDGKYDLRPCNCACISVPGRRYAGPSIFISSSSFSILAWNSNWNGRSLVLIQVPRILPKGPIQDFALETENISWIQTDPSGTFVKMVDASEIIIPLPF